MKWWQTASTTRYGSAYFFSKNIRRKIEFAPLYVISASLRMAAAECKTGMEQRASTDPTIIASLNVHVPLFMHTKISPSQKMIEIETIINLKSIIS